jgi:glycosyltransferase involved in cell wall biosynthesis
MKPKTILFVIESLHCGGAEKSVVTLLQNLDYKAYNVDLLLIKKGGEFEKFVPKEVTVIFKDIYSKNPLKHTISRLCFWFLKKQSHNKGYNTAHTFWTAFSKSIPVHQKKYDVAIGYSQGFATYYVAEKTYADKKLAWLNIDYKHARHFAEFDYTFYKQLNSVVCVSPECETAFINEMQVIEKNLPTTILKDITDEIIVKKLSTEQKGFITDEGVYNLLTVCRLAKQKGLHLAVNAAEILKNKNIHFKWYIIGEGTERNFLEQEIKNKGLEAHLILLGFKENPYPFMNTCNIYVQTSLFEGLGLTVIEAASLHKPIVTTNFPTSYHILTHEETGLICTMDAHAIADSILRYINDTDFSKKVINNLSKQKNTDKETSLNTFHQLIQSK